MRKIAVAIILLTSCSPRYFINKEIGSTEKLLQDHVGFYLVDLSTKKTLVDYNGEKYFTPASNTKIFTLYTALRLLGDSVASIKYEPRGDSLIFQGLGDPSFLYQNVFDNGRVYDFLKNHPNKLFISSTNFQTEKLGAGWAWDDYHFYFSAERSPFPLYGNLISIDRSPQGEFIFQPSRFDSSFRRATDLHRQEEIVRGIDSNELVYFDGTKRKNSWTIPFRTSDELTAQLLSDTLHRKVELIKTTLSKDALILKSIPSDSLYKAMMQESDNFVAEQLLLQCALAISDTLKPEIAIRHSTKNFLADLPDPPQWVDGSGLSRYNLFTPRSIVALWKKIYQAVPQERLFKIIATGGQNGTIKNWYKADVPYLFGKTGSLSNNHCLSGFLITKKNKILIFSCMNNNFTASSNEVRERLEKILKEVRERF